MKTLKIILPALFLLPMAPVFAQNVAGDWVWIGAGCRDRNLSESSHETRSITPNPFFITASDLTLRRDGSAAMTIEVNDADGRKEMNGTGFYEVENNRVVITDPKIENEDEQEVLVLDIVGEDLILDSTQVTDDPSADDSYNDDLCDSNKVFVFVFGSI